ncbi:MAG: hydroxymethylglutaryl-CoA lyase [Paracoccaceae bacterium]
MGEAVEIYEVGPRDGLQNEKRTIETGEKIALIDALSEVGFRRIEVASFVSPKWVPQMADGADVVAGIARRNGVIYTALTPNMQGFERAMAAGVDEIAVFASASEGFSVANLNCSISESFERFQPVIEAANAANVRVRGYLSCVIACPFDGPTPPPEVADVALCLHELGCAEISLGDTIGKGTPETVAAMLRAVLGVIPARELAGHFHDTGGRALANIGVSLEHGLRVFDASVGGLGGCPYAPGAPGNVATEAVDAYLRGLGYETGLDKAALARAVTIANSMKVAGKNAGGDDV